MIAARRSPPYAELEWGNNMANAEKYDAVVLGSGEASKFIAWHLSSLGKKVIVIERRWVGGSCPNIACLPSKNVIHSAKVASLFFRRWEFGISADNVTIDMARVRERKREMVHGLHEMHMGNFARNNTELLIGEGRFVGERTIRVSMPDGQVRTLQGDIVIVGTGTRAKIDDIPGLADSSPLTHVDALELDVVPRHLIILGGGYIGLEFAQAMRRLGSGVTVLERAARLLPHEDLDVSEAMHSMLADEGIEIVTDASTNRVSGRSGESVWVEIESSGTWRSIEGSHLLAATGRLPNTENIGLALAGIETTEQGFVKVNDRLETTAPGVWAVGDCAGSPFFTHIGFDDFRVFRDNYDGKHRSTAGRQVPFCLFTDPELARIGLNETEAAARGIRYRLGKSPMAGVLRTRTLSETRGFLKALVSADDDTILGFTGFGVGVGEMLPAVQLAMANRLPYTALQEMVLTHPTIGEGWLFLFSGVAASSSKGQSAGH